MLSVCRKDISKNIKHFTGYSINYSIKISLVYTGLILFSALVVALSENNKYHSVWL